MPAPAWSTFTLDQWDQFSLSDWDGFLLDPAEASEPWHVAALAVFCPGASAGQGCVQMRAGSLFNPGAQAGAVS